MGDIVLTFNPENLFEILNSRKSDLIMMCKSRGLSSVGSKETLQQKLLHYVGTAPKKSATNKLSHTAIEGANSKTLEPSAFSSPGLSGSNTEKPGDDEMSDVFSVFDPLNPGELEARTAVFVQNMKALILKRATILRLKGKVQNPHMLSKMALAEQVASSLLLKEFKANGLGKEVESLIHYDGFSKVLRSYRTPGAEPVREEVLNMLFDLCIPDGTTDVTETFAVVHAATASNPMNSSTPSKSLSLSKSMDLPPTGKSMPTSGRGIVSAPSLSATTSYLKNKLALRPPSAKKQSAVRDRLSKSLDLGVRLSMEQKDKLAVSADEIRQAEVFSIASKSLHEADCAPANAPTSSLKSDEDPVLDILLAPQPRAPMASVDLLLALMFGQRNELDKKVSRTTEQRLEGSTMAQQRSKPRPKKDLTATAALDGTTELAAVTGARPSTAPASVKDGAVLGATDLSGTATQQLSPGKAKSTSLIAAVTGGSGATTKNAKSSPVKLRSTLLSEIVNGNRKAFSRAESYSASADHQPRAAERLSYDPSNGPAGRMGMLPLKLRSRKSWSLMSAPASFGERKMRRSSQLPGYECEKDHVHGCSIQLNGGNNIYLVPKLSGSPPALSAGGGEGVEGGGKRANDDMGTGTEADGDKEVDRGGGSGGSGGLESSQLCTSVVYTAAAMGVTLDLATNEQKVFEGHSDDVTCVAVNREGTLAATGCCASVGKGPLALVWSPSDPSTILAQLGDGKFERGVDAIAFSYCSTLFVGIGCDDYHTMFIFKLATGEVVHQVSAAHDVPPAIHWLAWCESGQSPTPYITKDHTVPCDLIACAGINSIKLWSFRRPGKLVQDQDPYQTPSIQFKQCRITTQGPKAAKHFNCCAFIGSENALVSGCDNGMVYLFRACSEDASTLAVRGGVRALTVKESMVFCGGAGGIVKVLSKNLETLLTFSLAATGVMESKLDQSVVGIAVGQVARAAFSPGVVGTQLQLVCTTAAGKCLRVDVGAALATATSDTGEGRQGELDAAGAGAGAGAGANAGASASAGAGAGGSGSGGVVENGVKGGGLPAVAVSASAIFFYHTGDVGAVACSSEKSGTAMICTAGDDCILCLWDGITHKLLSREVIQDEIRSVGFDKTSGYICLGTEEGMLRVYSIEPIPQPPDFTYSLILQASRQDAKETCNDVKLSPNNKRCALASNDNYIYIYACSLAPPGEPPACQLMFLHKLSGHSSYIKQVDWSYDSVLLQSCCGSYELLCWDVEQAKLYTGPAADIRWKTLTCILGFPVIGIWEPYSDGTDVNAVDVAYKYNLLATAGDGGELKLFNYPCVLKDAPSRAYSGHSSFVQNVRWVYRAKATVKRQQAGVLPAEDIPVMDALATVGGRDATLIVWRLVKTVLPDETPVSWNRLEDEPEKEDTAMSGWGIKNPFQASLDAAAAGRHAKTTTNILC